MIESVSISVMQDLRREKENNTFPLKLRVHSGKSKRRKLYSLDLDYTKKEFYSIWKAERVNQKYKEEKKILQAIETRANEVLAEMKHFSFIEFERIMFGDPNISTQTINFFYKKTIENYRANDRIGTANNYKDSLKSLQSYYKRSVIDFEVITPDWLEKYQKWMEDGEKSLSTIGFYLRPLRAIFNKAIEEKAITADIYPFGKRKYVIPNPKGVKKALSKEQLKVLHEAKPKTPEQLKAKDFWFFSYLCNGMNLKDILYLKYKNIENEMISFKRAKTSKTNKDQKAIMAPLHALSKQVIEKYGNKPENPDSLIFPVIDLSQSVEDQNKKKDNFIRFINQHMAKFAKDNGINESVSTYWARHTFATMVVRSGEGLEVVSEALGHSNLNTTKNYFAGFEDEKKREISNKLLEF